MTNQEILDVALKQSAVDLNCESGDFLLSENRIVHSTPREGARAYLKLPFECQLVSYGNNVVASVLPQFEAITRAYLEGQSVHSRFETPYLHLLDRQLAEHGVRVCFMAEYFLPDLTALRPLPCPLKTRLLGPSDFEALYTPEWGHALCKERKRLDVLGVGAFDGDRLAGLAACSADCDSMWQIGIDVLPEYRRRGVASAITSRLAIEILKRGKTPFYCAAWSNIRSVRNAIRSGFRPAWVEMTARSLPVLQKFWGERSGAV